MRRALAVGVVVGAGWIGLGAAEQAIGQPADLPNAAPPEPAVPPRGLPHPRLDGMPGNPDHPLPPDRRDETFTRRVPSHEARAREDRQRAAEQAATVEVGTDPPARGQTCADLTPEERVSCPLERLAPPRRMERLENGVRLHLRGGNPGRISRVLECQAALASGGTDQATPCAFLGPDRRTVVSGKNGRLVVDVIATDGDGPGIVEEEVETALRSADREAAPRPAPQR